MPLLLLALAGCESWLDEGPAPAPIPEPAIDGPVFTAVVTRAPVPPPKLWADGLPTMPGTLGADAQLALDAVCYGLPGARDAVLAVIDEGDWGRWLQLCDDPGFCAWAFEQPRRDGILVAAAGCPVGEDVFTASDTPDSAVAAWFAEQGRLGRIEYHPRLQQAAERLARDGDPAAADAVAALGALPDGEMRLLALRASAAPWVAQEIALALRLSRTSAGQEAWATTCQALGWSGERCVAPDPALRDPLTHLDEAVRRYDLEPGALLARHPMHGTAIRGALERCVRDAELGTLEVDLGRRCLAALARSDRAQARGLADGLTLQDDGWDTLVASLRRYDGPDALIADVVARGLAPEGTTAPDALTPVDVLVAAGVAAPMSTFGQDAQGYLVRAIAALAGLGHVPIVVQPPIRREGAPEVYAPRLTQLAWVDGVRLRALAHDYGYVDVAQAVGFVNALLAEVGSSERVVVAVGEQGSWVAVVGEANELQALADDGLLVPWLPTPETEG